MSGFVRLTVALCVAMLAGGPASAQVVGGDSFEIAVGGGWVSGFDLGSATATLTANASNSTVTLFDTETALRAAPRFEMRMSYPIARVWAAEMGLAYGRPEIRTTISSDFERAPESIAVDRVHEYVFDGALTYQPAGWRFGAGRGRVFVSGGAGYLRDLHEGRTLVESGIRYHMGGGAKYLFASRPGRAIRGFGVRADARFYLQDDGADLGTDALHKSLATAVSLLMTF